MRRPFVAKPGGVRFKLSGDEATFLGQLPMLLVQVVETPGDPGGARLQIPVYLNDPEAEGEFRRWIGPELEQSRVADRSVFLQLVNASVKGTVANSAQAEAFLRVLAEGRLVLAARLGIEVEEDYARLAITDAAALNYLAQLQTLLMDALVGT